MSDNKRYKPYLTDKKSSPDLPVIPENYGVSKRPVIIISVVATILVVTLTAFTVISFVTWNTPILGSILASITILIISLWVITLRINKEHIQNKFRNLFIIKVMTPWFKNYYNLEPYPDVISDFLNGTPIFVDKNTYLYPRWDENTQTAYTSVSAPQQLAEATNEKLLPYPRVKLTHKTRKPKIYITENSGYITVNVDGQTIILPPNAK